MIPVAVQLKVTHVHRKKIRVKINNIGYTWNDYNNYR